jgi:predicted permease
MTRDLRIAWRGLWRHPVHAGIALGTLTLGLSATIVAVGLVDAIGHVSQRLPDADRWGWLFVGTRANRIAPVSVPVFDAIARDASPLAQVAAEGRVPLALDAGASVDRVWALAVSPNYFSIVHVSPLIGRPLSASDVGDDDVPVLAREQFWRRRMGGRFDGSAVRLTLNGRPAVVVGVLPDRFQGPGGLFDPDLWVPLAARDALHLSDRLASQDERWLTLIARPRDLVAPAALDARVEATIRAADPQVDDRLRVEYVRLSDGHPDARAIGRVAFRGLLFVGLVFTIACFNVAGLTLTRALDRRRDLAVRIALGSSAWRLAKLLLLEGLILSMLATTIAALAAIWSKWLLAAFSLPAPIPQRLHLDVSWHVAIATVALAVMAALIPVIAPLWQLLRGDLTRWVRTSGNASTADRAHLRAQRTFVQLQVAGATAFLAAALAAGALFVESRRVDPGFDVDRLVTLDLDVRQLGYTRDRAHALASHVIDRLQPSSARAVAIASRVPFYVGMTDIHPVEIDGMTCDAAHCPGSGLYAVTPDFFAVMGMPLRAGRALTDDPSDRDAIVVSETAAARFWPGRSALGGRLRDMTTGRSHVVVGVVRDVIHRQFAEPAMPYVYRRFDDEDYAAPFTIVARAPEPSTLVAPMRRAAADFDRTLSPPPIQTMRERTALPLWLPRTLAGFFGVCGAVAIVLSTVGLFGMIYASVSRRTREFAIRLAIGAAPRDVLRQVAQETLRVALPGVTAGMLIAGALLLVVRSSILVIGRLTFWPILTAGVLQIAVTAMAGLVPARRASSVDPQVALRQE